MLICLYFSPSVSVSCGPPTSSLDKFSGTLLSVTRYKAPGDAVNIGASQQLPDTSAGSAGCDPAELDLNAEEVELLSDQYSLNPSQFLLRGTSLVNTAWLYAVVVYVAMDTRIFRNANTKVSQDREGLGRVWLRRVQAGGIAMSGITKKPAKTGETVLAASHSAIPFAFSIFCV